MDEYRTIRHEFAPVWDEHAKILILGTFPSVKSRENHFYYGHPQNRFWKLLAAVYGEPLPEDIAQKKELLLRHRLAVWDVIDQCEIIGSSDSSIRGVVPADVAGLLAKTDIRTVLLNGAKAYELYNRYQRAATGIEGQKLPSTSPANAAWSFARLLQVWQKALLRTN